MCHLDGDTWTPGDVVVRPEFRSRRRRIERYRRRAASSMYCGLLGCSLTFPVGSVEPGVEAMRSAGRVKADLPLQLPASCAIELLGGSHEGRDPVLQAVSQRYTVLRGTSEKAGLFSATSGFHTTRPKEERGGRRERGQRSWPANRFRDLASRRHRPVPDQDDPFLLDDILAGGL